MTICASAPTKPAAPTTSATSRSHAPGMRSARTVGRRTVIVELIESKLPAMDRIYACFRTDVLHFLDNELAARYRVRADERIGAAIAVLLSRQLMAIHARRHRLHKQTSDGGSVLTAIAVNDRQRVAVLHRVVRGERSELR